MFKKSSYSMVHFPFDNMYSCMRGCVMHGKSLKEMLTSYLGNDIIDALYFLFCISIAQIFPQKYSS